MKNTLYHNPRCSKSRQTLELLQAREVDFEIVEYLKTPPSLDDLKELMHLLNKEPLEWLRSNEDCFKTLGLSKKDLRGAEAWLQLMHENPILIERPIFVYHQKAVIGRPPEQVLALL